jgi:hypothetical protein
MSQQDSVLAYLKSRQGRAQGLTQAQAVERWKAWRLPVIISRMRDRGFQVETVRYGESGSGRYYLRGDV